MSVVQPSLPVPGSTTCDVVVVGGGPCGSALARQLAVWGHRVVLLARDIDRARGLAESIPPSARKLLAALDILPAVERAAFPPNRGNTVWWAGDARVEEFGEAGERAGFLVFRPDLDDLLLAHAAAGGADIRLGVAARSIEWRADGVTVHADGPDGPSRVDAEYIVDCSGRAGVVARQGFRRYEPGHRMQALLGLWEGPDGWAGDDRTLVETYDAGWAWSVAISERVRQVAVMVDGRTSGTRRESTLAATYVGELARTRHARAQSAGARLAHVWACDASLYSARTYVGARFLLAGDAAACIDPLSSFGVKKGLSSAWLAAVAVHTAIVDSSRRELAFRFFDDRERTVYATELARTREYARQAALHHGHPFWQGRAAAGGQVPEDPVDRLLRRDVVRAAHARLRAGAGTLIAAGAPRAPLPRVVGREIVADEGLRLDDEVVRFAAGVDLVALLALAGHAQQVPGLYDAYCRAVAPVPLPQFLTGVSLLMAERALADLSDTTTHP